ncbi:hypothetical protein ACJJTC_004070 [Scirpophaga incertulas]
MVKTFEGIVDRYSGITVDSQKETCDIDQLDIILSDSLKKWTEEAKRCIWFKVHISEAAWIPLLANNSFNFHHARDNFVMMYKWLPTNRSANLPPACHTNLGVGGLVINDNNQLLVVVEKHTEIAHWKLPGGYVEIVIIHPLLGSCPHIKLLTMLAKKKLLGSSRALLDIQKGVPSASVVTV